jgi:hypothetical protein
MMRIRASGLIAALAVVTVLAGTASACHRCGQTPCVLPPPRPAYQCVTDWVPYTVMQPRTRVEFRPVTETVMVNVPETTWTECQRLVCRPVFDTQTVSRQVVVCKPVFDTTYVNQTWTVCRPVSTTRQVTEYCLQPSTKWVSVAARRCSLCGGSKPSCGCVTVAMTCYTPVPVVRDVVETTWVPETQTRQVPVTTCRLVRELETVQVPYTTCRVVQEVVTVRIPHTTFKCVPQVITRQIPYPVCETVAVTCYRPVTRLVPCAPAAYAAPQAAPAASGQAPSAQGPSGQS